jgi:UDPglucose 6-dehydrogenase
MKVCVIGTGYVGLVAGTCFAEVGNDVVCVDIDAEKVATLAGGTPTIYEPGLEELMRRNMKEHRLSFTTDLAAAVKQSLFCFIAVGTPERSDGAADLSGVLSVARAIGEAMDGYRVIVNKSTVPVGTAERVRREVQAVTMHPFDVVSNPEFLKEGAAIDDFLKPDRVVIGSDSTRAAEMMEELYGPFVRTGNPIIHMDIESAELTKYAANAMLATRISFMNEIANICMRVGANVDLVRKGIGSDARIGSRFLFAGLGYGGSCFPKDVQAIVKTSSQHGYRFRILEAVEEVNERQKRLLFEMVTAHYGENLQGKRFAIWGLSFKPNTDDMREAPAIVVIEALLAAGATVRAYDPEAMKEAKHRHFGDRIEYAENPMDALPGADALVLVTEWNEFRRPDFDAIKEKLRTPVVFDGRNIYRRKTLEGMGFTYYGIGT